MPLQIYNSLTHKKEIFVPLHPPKVKMYCCGPTVYDFLHIGNFRGAVFYNFFREWLEQKGYQVTYAYNFTDVDDKILNRAKEEKRSMKEIADTYIGEFKKDFQMLKLRNHDFNPQATQFIPDMVRFIEELCKKGKAYSIEGDVFYHVPSFSDYGELSGRKKSEVMNQARIEKDERKKDSRDFALWKSCPEKEPGWSSPWGHGRPGWHIECTTMIFSLLGSQIDIHGGGTDLIFPHHENERAQAQGVQKETFVKYWVHNNMFTFTGEKMAKSLGNQKSMRSFLETYNEEIFKYLVLSSHYRSPTEVSENTINQSIQALARIYSFLKTAEEMSSEDRKTPEDLLKAEKKIEKALDNDLNTPSALAEFFTLIRQFNEKQNQTKTLSEKEIFWTDCLKKLIKKYGKIMSLFQEPPAKFLTTLDDIFLKKNNVNREEIEQMVQRRVLARKGKDFKAADEIRKQLLEKNIEVKDSPFGSTWEAKKKN